MNKLSINSRNIIYWVTGGLLVASAYTFGPIINRPQCPEGLSPEQIQETSCIIGANIGMALLITYVILPLGIVAAVLWTLKLWSLLKAR